MRQASRSFLGMFFTCGRGRVARNAPAAREKGKKATPRPRLDDFHAAERALDLVPHQVHLPEGALPQHLDGLQVLHGVTRPGDARPTGASFRRSPTRP